MCREIFNAHGLLIARFATGELRENRGCFMLWYFMMGKAWDLFIELSRQGSLDTVDPFFLLRFCHGRIYRGCGVT